MGSGAYVRAGASSAALPKQAGSGQDIGGHGALLVQGDLDLCLCLPEASALDRQELWLGTLASRR